MRNKKMNKQTVWTEPVDHADWIVMKELKRSINEMKKHAPSEDDPVNYDLSIKYEKGLLKKFFNKVTIH
jgi:hypothetical protein